MSHKAFSRICSLPFRALRMAERPYITDSVSDDGKSWLLDTVDLLDRWKRLKIFWKLVRTIGCSHPHNRPCAALRTGLDTFVRIYD
jgi:hypothetical protein